MGDGTTKGSCPDKEARGNICYSDGKCGLCSKDAVGGTAGDGNGRSKGNCPDGLICSEYGCGTITDYYTNGP